jgi:hypothetical protein
MTIGTDVEIIPPASPAIAGADAERLPEVRTNATSDQELLLAWLRSHADSSPHTVAGDGLGLAFADLRVEDAAAGSEFQS